MIASIILIGACTPVYICSAMQWPIEYKDTDATQPKLSVNGEQLSLHELNPLFPFAKSNENVEEPVQIHVSYDLPQQQKLSSSAKSLVEQRCTTLAALHKISCASLSENDDEYTFSVEDNNKNFGSLRKTVQTQLEESRRLKALILAKLRSNSASLAEHDSEIEALRSGGERAGEAITEMLKRYGNGKLLGSELQSNGVVQECQKLMQRESTSDHVRGLAGTLITLATGLPVTSNVADVSTGGYGHVNVVVPRPSRVYA